MKLLEQTGGFQKLYEVGQPCHLRELFALIGPLHEHARHFGRGAGCVIDLIRGLAILAIRCTVVFHLQVHVLEKLDGSTPSL